MKDKDISEFSQSVHKNTICIYNQLLLNNLQVISQKYGRNL